MTHEEAKAWLTEHGLFPRVMPVAEPGMWHLRKEADGFAEFVHRRTGEVVVFEVLTAASKCTSRPDCPCDFCVRIRAEIAGGRSEKDVRDQTTLEWITEFTRKRDREMDEPVQRENLVFGRAPSN